MLEKSCAMQSRPPFDSAKAFVGGASVLLLALSACGSPSSDEPDFSQPEEATAYTTNSPEGACLAAVAERAGGAALQVTKPGAEVVGVTADDVLWTCRMNPDGSVATVVAPGPRP